MKIFIIFIFISFISTNSNLGASCQDLIQKLNNLNNEELLLPNFTEKLKIILNDFLNNKNSKSYKIFKRQKYILPQLLPEKTMLVREQIKLGKQKRASNMTKIIYQKNIQKLKKLFDKNGRITFKIKEQKTIKSKISTLEKDYNLKINYKKNKPYVTIENQEQNLVSLFNKYIKFFNRNNLEEISDRDAQFVIQYLTNNKTRFESINQKELNKKLKHLHENGVDYSKNSSVQSLLQFLLKNEIYYNTTVKEIFNFKFEQKKNERLFLAISDLINKFRNFNNQVHYSLSRNYNIDSNNSYSELIFSINPYDIAMMSTQKRWTSCTEAEDKAFNSVSNEIGAFTIIVYGTNNGDLKNPINRILLKPYLSEEMTSIIWLGKKIYGESDKKLLELVNKITNQTININKPDAIHTLDNSIYVDGYPKFNFDFSNKQEIIKNAKKYSDLYNWKIILSKFSNDYDIQLLAVQTDGKLIRYIKNPEKNIQVEAIKENIWAIKDIENPTKKVKILLVQAYGWMIHNITDPCKDVQIEAVKQDGTAIQYIKDPEEDVQVEAVKESGNAFKHIRKPTKKVIKLYNKLWNS